MVYPVAVNCAHGYLTMYSAPFLAFIVILCGQGVAEFAAMWRTGTLRRKHTREWTFYVVAVPFKAMLALSIIEHAFWQTQPLPAMLIAGIVLSVAGTVIRVRGHLDLDGAFSRFVEKADNHKLADSGLYTRIRHPMYVGSILLFVGMPLVLGSRWAWVFAGLGVIGIFLRIRAEEAFLSRELPGYREYIGRTWRLVPHVY